MFARGLGIIWVIPGAPHLASAAGVTTCGKRRETRVNWRRAEMKRDRGLL
jgi:hypothetical protein